MSRSTASRSHCSTRFNVSVRNGFRPIPGAARESTGADPDAGHGPSGSTTSECEVQTAFSVASPAKTFCSGSNLTGVVRVHVVVVNASAAGSVQLQASNSSGSGTVTIKAGSDLVARRTG